jgi:hypothetical protein
MSHPEDKAPLKTENLNWHDKKRIGLIRMYLERGIAVAVFLIDGGWQYFGIKGKGVHKVERLFRIAPETLVGVYQANENTSPQKLEQIIMGDLDACGVLSMKIRI